MKREILSLVTISLIATNMLAGCGNSNATNSTADTETVAEAVHEHNYIETVTTAPTCETDGEATYTCECGDTYTASIPATGHSFTNYVANNDATSESDGTETAKCDNCDATDTRTAEGSKLAYTFKDITATKYAKSTVNVRNLPDSNGEKLGGLSANDEVKVTGQCNETGWYRIEYNGNTAYVSDSYLVDNKIETKKASTQSTASTQSNDSGASQASSSQPNNSSGNTNKKFSTYTEAHDYFASKYSPMDTIIDNGDGTYSYYDMFCHDPNANTDMWIDMDDKLYATLSEKYGANWNAHCDYIYVERVGSDWDLIYVTATVTVK